MLAASQALAALAVLLVGVIYGTDIFSAVVLRPAMAALTDRELTQAAGRIHQYGDQRLPLPGAAGTVAAAAAAICAGCAGQRNGTAHSEPNQLMKPPRAIGEPDPPIAPPPRTGPGEPA